ncbi:MAG: addiction module antitoxin RelB [Candidatus Hydrogenedentes bacterium CG07_land_8_20_14_0_80_42_17]|nr:MAG: hypothetical protein AUJ18_02820 [Candidatus Hydrogenedentes bacterium CG1_02_42_14]PIU48369.1 MAG: addiction module antitoxin RelB [Candidatus Hydrogenedentes bacterium CG07_land_8_20_14_0_80_42_17]
MENAIRLDEMTVEEKIRTMEYLWDDLCRSADAITSPGWHGQILEQREQAIVEGREKIIDWDIEKNNIHQSLK